MIRLVLLLASLLAGSGSEPYRSMVPLGAPGSAPFEEGLIGTWRSTTTGLPAHDVIVERDGPQQYHAVVRIPDPANDSMRLLRLRVYTTEVNGVRFLNIHLPDAMEIPEIDFAYFMRFELRGDELRGRAIVQGAGEAGLSEQYRTTEALRAAVLARLEDPRLYGEESTWRRAAPAAP